MANQLDTTTLVGIVSMGEKYLASLAVGQKHSDFGHATSATDAGILGDLEVDGEVYLDGTFIAFEQGFHLDLADNNANSFLIGASPDWLMRFDTTTGAFNIELNENLELDAAGFTNANGSTGSVRQQETFVYSLGDGDAAGGVLDQLNPFGANSYVRIEIEVTTVATAACTIDVGVAATGVSSDTLIDGLDVNSATGLFSSAEDGGANGETFVLIASGQYITASMATGAAADLVGKAYVTLQQRA